MVYLFTFLLFFIINDSHKNVAKIDRMRRDK